ncbi:hypothetical protein Tsp_13352, partial [Trichinella spiralis]
GEVYVIQGQGYIWTALDKKTLHVEKQFTLIDELDVLVRR